MSEKQWRLPPHSQDNLKPTTEHQVGGVGGDVSQGAPQRKKKNPIQSGTVAAAARLLPEPENPATFFCLVFLF